MIYFLIDKKQVVQIAEIRYSAQNRRFQQIGNQGKISILDWVRRWNV